MLEALEARIAPASNVFAGYSGWVADHSGDFATGELGAGDAAVDLTLAGNTVAADGQTLFDGGVNEGYLSADRSALVFSTLSDPDLNFGVAVAAADLTGKTAAERLAFLNGTFNGASLVESSDYIEGIPAANISGSGMVDLKVVFDGKGKAVLTVASPASNVTANGTYTVGEDGRFTTAGTYTTFGITVSYAFEGYVSYDGLKLIIKNDAVAQAGTSNDLTEDAVAALVKAGSGVTPGFFPQNTVYKGVAPLQRGAVYETMEVQLTILNGTQYSMLYDSLGSNFSSPESYSGTYTISSTGALALKGTGLPVLNLDVSADGEMIVGVDLDTTAAGDNSSGGVFLVRAHNSPNDFILSGNATFNLVTGGSAAVTLSGARAAVKLADQSFTLGSETVNFTPIQFSTIEQIEIIEVTSTTAKLGVALTGSAGTTIERVFTSDTGQPFHMDSITLGKGITLGDGVAGLPDLVVTGALKTLTLDDVAANTTIRLGGNLVYDNPLNTLDSKGNRPNLTLGDVGSNVLIDLLDDAPNAIAGTGGGGLGNVTIGSWISGAIKTTQSVGNITVLNGGFAVDLQIDQFHDGNTTNADAGLVTVAKGDFTGTHFIEGRLAGIKAGGYDGTLQAAALGSLAATRTGVFGSGVLDGSITLGNTSAPLAVAPALTALTTVTSTGDFLADLDSPFVVGNFTVGGDFKGSVRAVSIGTLTARSFDGGTADDPFDLGDPLRGDLVATGGGIGAVKTTAGVFAGYDIQASGAFGGITVALANQTVSRVGIENVTVNALSIGNLAVTLGGSTAVAAPAIDLTGIKNSSFITSGSGNTTATKGNIGTVTVKLTGKDVLSAWVGLDQVILDAKSPASTVNTVGALSVDLTTTVLSGDLTVMDGVNLQADIVGTLTGTAKATTGPGNLTGITDSTFTASGLAFNKAGTMGAAKVTLTSPTLLTSAIGIKTTTFNSPNALFGGLTVAMTNVTGTAIGLDDIDVNAFSSGNIAVTLAGATLAATPAIELTGIRNSDFFALGTGSTTATKGSIGTVTVGLSGRDVSGTWQGLLNSNFNASPGASTINSIGDVSVSATATAGTSGGEIILVGFTNFTADTLGNFTLNGKATSDAGPLHGWMNSDLTANGTGATGKIGNLSVTLMGSSSQTASTAITGSTITANNGALGNITTTQTNQSGAVLGINGVNITADTIGNISSTITGKTGLAITTATALNAVSLSTDGSVANKAGNIGTITAKVDLAGSAGTAVVADNLFTTATGTLGNLAFTALSSNATANLTGLGTFGLAATGSVGTFTVLAQNTNAAVLPSGTGTVAAISTPSAATFITSFTGSVGAVKITAAGGAASTQLSDTLNPFSISAQQNVGTVSFITTKSAKVVGATAEGVRNTVITATNGDVGALSITGDTTAAQADGLAVTAGGKIGAITVSATTKANSDLLNSTFRAGADNTAAAATSLIAESIGAVTVSGDAINTFLFAFGNIGAVKVDGVLADSLVVAGIKLGGDNILSAGDTFNRHASLTSLTVGGALSTTSVVAGIDHGGDGVWGQGNDTAGAAIAGIAANGKIGAITLGAGSGAYTTPSAISHDFAIESLAIASLKVGTTTTAATSLAGGGYLDSNTAFTEDAIDTLVRILLPV
jgi:mucin-19